MSEYPAAAIAAKLTAGQRSTVLGLNSSFCVLGCSEQCAIRLTKDGPRRPALAEEGPRSPEGYRTFRLTLAGLAVSYCLSELVEEEAE